MIAMAWTILADTLILEDVQGPGIPETYQLSPGSYRGTLSRLAKWQRCQTCSAETLQSGRIRRVYLKQLIRLAFRRAAVMPQLKTQRLRWFHLHKLRPSHWRSMSARSESLDPLNSAGFSEEHTPWSPVEHASSFGEDPSWGEMNPDGYL